MTDAQHGEARPSVAVLGGAVAGLAAAERFRSFADVHLFERQRYGEKRVNCGEAMNEASLVPLAKTPENGFVNPVSGFDVEFYRSTSRAQDATPLTVARIGVEDGYVTDRNAVERRWADRLREDDAVTVSEGANVSVGRYRELVDAYDYVVDATGQPSLSTKARGETDAYTGDIVALNADVTGDFGDLLDYPSIVFEGYMGYLWAFPKSERRANVGIGWAEDHRPDDYMEALWEACDRAGVPRPDRADTNVYTIPQGPSLHPGRTHPDPGVFLVGDAAGIANRYQGEGIAQAIRSAYLLADLVEAGREESYPSRLYETMRSEYRLATLMRGVFAETDDPELIADVAAAIDGLTVADVTRRPRRVYARLVRHPRLLARLVSVPGLRRRLRDAYRDRWEFG
ncbi:MAG: NAD(P)/FAD-dependent oxidoreductase, partial [Haloferacaceae archaeon]